MRDDLDNTISAVVKRPGGVAKREEIVNNLETLQLLVGGDIEVIPLPYCLMIVNEDGRRLGLPENFTMSGTPILGTAVFVGNGGEDFADCYYSWETIANESGIRIGDYPECPLCRNKSLKIRDEQSFEDMGVSGDGIVGFYDCENCGCSVETWMPFREEE